MIFVIFFHVFPLFLATSQCPPPCSDGRAQPARGPGSLHIADLRKSFHKPGVFFFCWSQLVSETSVVCDVSSSKMARNGPIEKSISVFLQWPMESQNPWWMWSIQILGVATGRPCERELRTLHVFGRCEAKHLNFSGTAWHDWWFTFSVVWRSRPFHMDDDDQTNQILRYGIFRQTHIDWLFLIWIQHFCIQKQLCIMRICGSQSAHGPIYIYIPHITICILHLHCTYDNIDQHCI